MCILGPPLPPSSPPILPETQIYREIYKVLEKFCPKLQYIEKLTKFEKNFAQKSVTS